MCRLAVGPLWLGVWSLTLAVGGAPRGLTCSEGVPPRLWGRMESASNRMLMSCVDGQLLLTLKLRGGGKAGTGRSSGENSGGGRNKDAGRSKRSGRGRESRRTRMRTSRRKRLGMDDEDGKGMPGAEKRVMTKIPDETGPKTADAEERFMKEMQQKTKTFATPILSKSTFSGLFENSPRIDLPGQPGLTLEHFRTERRTVDDEGNDLPKCSYLWRNRLVRVTLRRNGENDELVDAELGTTLHRFAEKTLVFLQGHENVYLEDFAHERMTTKTMGVYKWRDRVVRVLMSVKGKVDRIVDEADGNVVFLFEDDDQQDKLLLAEMFDEAMFSYDRPGTLARAAHQAQVMSGDGPPYGEVLVAWPEQTEEGMHHGGTVIWLHEMGSNARESAMSVAKLNMPWIKFVMPTAPTQAVAVLNGTVCKSWFDVYKLGSKFSKEDSEGLERSTEYISKLIEDEIERGMPPESIALVGVGQGGCVALNAALRGYRWREPEHDEESEEMGTQSETIMRLAAVAGLSTWLPKSMLKLRPFWYDDMYPTYWNGEVVGRGGGLPTLLCHGKADAFVPFELGRRSYKRAEKLGLAAELKRYEGMGHGLCREELYDVEFFLSRTHLADPVLRVDQIFGPRVVAVEGMRSQLAEAGMNPDMIDEKGWFKPEYDEGAPPKDYVDQEDLLPGIVSVFGQD